jgi:molybdate transport system substrate-binding protein
MKSALRTWLLLSACLFGLQSLAADSEKAITVFAAASLTNALQDLGDAFTKDTSIPVRFSFAASSTLGRQIESGWRADLFFSADLEWMDCLQARNLIQPASRHDVLGNQLVLIAPVSSKISLIAPHFALAAAIGPSHLATGDPDSVPQCGETPSTATTAA